MKTLTLSSLVAVLPFCALGQHISNIVPQAVGSKIVVHYDIEEFKDDQVFEVALYYSKDKYATALSHVSGDGIGASVNGGKGRVIIWDVLRDTKELIGEQLSFEVRAMVKKKAAEVVLADASAGRGVTVTSKDDAYPLISNTLLDYINEAKDFKDVFQMLGAQATESRQALAKLNEATEQYNRAFEKLNKERLTYEKYVSLFWKNEVQTLEFKTLMDYALGDLHSVNILTLNQKISVINEIINGRVKRSGEKKKELTKDISEETLKLDKRLQELERRANRILYDLSQE